VQHLYRVFVLFVVKENNMHVTVGFRRYLASRA
jgi:hypothetical protein